MGVSLCDTKLLSVSTFVFQISMLFSVLVWKCNGNMLSSILLVAAAVTSVSASNISNLYVAHGRNPVGKYALTNKDYVWLT